MTVMASLIAGYLNVDDYNGKMKNRPESSENLSLLRQGSER